MSAGMQLPIRPESGGKHTDGFCTPKQDTRPQVMLVPPKRVLPIIFIPGIMGSNLRMNAERQQLLGKRNNIAWRIDSSTEVARLIGLNAADRQRQLDPSTTSVDSYDHGRSETGNPNETTLDRNDAVDVDRLYQRLRNTDPGVLLIDDPSGARNAKSRHQKALERGWGEILFDSYGDLLQTLEKQMNDAFSDERSPSGWWKDHVLNKSPNLWGAVRTNPQSPLTSDDLTKALSKCWFPVHAMGYNWLESNEITGVAIADRVRSLLARYVADGYQCEKVVLITHSMGGLVVRSAMHPQIGNLQNEVLGVVHGVMPATGAGTTYKRMRCGFEGRSLRPSRNVLGRTGMEVTAVLGNAQGGMELLPTQSYGNGWLQVHCNNRAVFTLPTKGDPYEEIYKLQGRWYQLLNPAWINLAGLPRRGLPQSLQLLDSAKAFHIIINGYYHPNSFAIYGADAQRMAWGNVIWRLNRQVDPQDVSGLLLRDDDATGELGLLLPLAMSRNSAQNRGRNSEAISAVLGPPVDAGDETVPIRSSDDQVSKCKVVFRQAGYDHQASYQDDRAISASLFSIIRIISSMKWSAK